MDERFPWLMIDDEPTPNHGFEPFKISRKSVPAFAAFVAHIAHHATPDADEIEIELCVKMLFEGSGPAIVTPQIACDVGKIIEYGTFTNLLPENIDRSN